MMKNSKVNKKNTCTVQAIKKNKKQKFLPLVPSKPEVTVINILMDGLPFFPLNLYW